MFANQSIRAYARNKGVFFYEVAEVLGISEPTMTRKLRKELPEAEKSRIYQIIDSIAAEKTAAVAAK